MKSPTPSYEPDAYRILSSDHDEPLGMDPLGGHSDLAQGALMLSVTRSVCSASEENENGC
jgi:hypothetical protein